MRLFFICLALMVGLNGFAQEVTVGNVTNKIVLGPLAGSQELTFGVKYLTNQILQYEGYTVTDNANTTVEIEFLFFDVKKTSVQLAVMSRNKEEYQITARAYLKEGGKVKKKATHTEYAVNKSKSAIIIDKGGEFSDAALDSAVKKVLFELIKKLKL